MTGNIHFRLVFNTIEHRAPFPIHLVFIYFDEIQQYVQPIHFAWRPATAAISAAFSGCTGCQVTEGVGKLDIH
jgi:hypothetical protein